jgi:hypothetical protein
VDVLGDGPVRVTVESDQLGVAAYKTLVPADDDFTEVDLALTAAGRVEGVVVDRTGAPLPAVTVRLLDPARSTIDQEPWLSWAADYTDEQGRFRIAGIPGGGPPLTLQVLGPDGRPAGDPQPLLGDPARIVVADDATVVSDARLVVDVERVVVPLPD